MEALRYLRHWILKFWSYIIKAFNGPEWDLSEFIRHNFQCIWCLPLKVCIKPLLFSVGLLLVHIYFLLNRRRSKSSRLQSVKQEVKWCIMQWKVCTIQESGHILITNNSPPLGGEAENNQKGQAGQYSSSDPHLTPILTISTSLFGSAARQTRSHYHLTDNLWVSVLLLKLTSFAVQVFSPNKYRCT